MAPLEVGTRNRLLFLSFSKTRSPVAQDDQVAKDDFVLWTLLHPPQTAGIIAVSPVPCSV